MKNKIKYLFLILYIVMIGIIFYSSLENSSKSSKESSTVTNEIIEVVEVVTNEKVILDYDTTHYYVRKVIGHFGSFVLCSIFGLLCFYFFILNKYKATLISVTVGIIIAIIAELLQLTSSGRSCEVKDMLIDYSGYLTGTIISFLIILLIRKKQNKKSIE